MADPRLDGWLAERLPGAVAPFRLEPLAGGNSNLTYRVTDAAGHTWVLRRPPHGWVPTTAHDVLREARILTAVRVGGVPVPEVLATCSDATVSDAPFVVMEHVTGTSCHGTADAALLRPEQRQRAGESLVTTLAVLHQLDPGDVGLADLGHHGAYLERQLARWRRQWQATRTRDLPALEETFHALGARVPEQRRTSVVHGDYRLDNCILGANGSVRAVLDWEISALGDPLADLGTLLAYWALPGDDVRALQDPPTAVPGFPDREQLSATYLTAAGLDGADVEYYVAFAWWRLACIVEGVHARAVHTPPPTGRSPESYADQAARLAEHAWQLALSL